MAELQYQKPQLSNIPELPIEQRSQWRLKQVTSQNLSTQTLPNFPAMKSTESVPDTDRAWSNKLTLEHPMKLYGMCSLELGHIYFPYTSLSYPIISQIPPLEERTSQKYPWICPELSNTVTGRLSEGLPRTPFRQNLAWTSQNSATKPDPPPRAIRSVSSRQWGSLRCTRPSK